MQKLLYTLRCALLAALCGSAANATIVDKFEDNVRSDWADFTFVPNFGLPKEQNGHLEFNLPPAGQALFVATTKIGQTYTITEGKTVEFRVDLVSGNGGDAFAVLGFMPAGQEKDLAGYGFAKSTSDILVTKGINKYFLNDNPDIPIKNENVTMVLRLTGQNGNVVINARVLDKDDGNAVIFDRTYVDTPDADILDDGTDDPKAPYLTGNFVLLCYEDFDNAQPQEVYQVIFDNAESFETQNTVLDDFNDNTKTAWSDFTFVPNFGLPTEANGQYNFNLPPAGQALFVASTKTTKTFNLVEGERVEFSVDLITGNGKDAFAVLAFIPPGKENELAGYGFAKSTTDILVSKGINKYFYNENPPEPVKNDNVRMILSLTAREGNVEINARVVDLDNDNAVLFEKSFVDTPAADVLADGDDAPAAPILGEGRFVLYCYEDFDPSAPQDVYTVIFDNAMAASAPLPSNTAPSISDITPAPFANFSSATTFSFKVTDDHDLANENIEVTLNGEKFTSANGLNITGTGSSRTVTLNNIAPGGNYIALISVKDADNATTTTTTYFDTFGSDAIVVEAEDYNFASGLYINDPVPTPENFGPQENSYMNVAGTPEVDYHDTRTDFRDAPYRFYDNVRMQHSLDAIRSKFTAAGGTENFVFDYDIGDIAAGEWLNYTRTFPAGSYEVYLRESLVNGTRVEAALEKVTSDPTMEDQTTEVLGSFLTPTTGFQFRNVPLTDATGLNKLILRLSGETTLRLRQITGEPSDGSIYQNYLVFVPVDDTVQRATITSLAPANGTEVQSVTPTITATVQNRDTTVTVSSIKLYVNGNPVNATVTPTASGADISYLFGTLPPSGSSITGRIEFSDNEDVKQTNEWSFTLSYLTLNPANRKAGTPGDRGFNYRFVQAPAGSNLENSLLRAEEQLAANSTLPEFVDMTTVVDVINFEQTGFETGLPGDIIPPGMDLDSGNGNDDFTVEAQAYLELSAGIHRFGVVTDDGYKLSAGASPSDKTPVLKFRSGATANETFDVVVPEAGLYPIRFVWYERSGGASAEFFTEDRTTGERTLVNDSTVPNAIKAFTSVTAPNIQVLSAPSVLGPFTLDASAVLDTNGRRVTVSTSENARFFLIQTPNNGGGSNVQLKNSALSGNSLVFQFE